MLLLTGIWSPRLINCRRVKERRQKVWLQLLVMSCFLSHNDCFGNRCLTCGREFKRASHLKTHMRSSCGVKAHLCSICNKSFTSIQTFTVWRTCSSRFPLKTAFLSYLPHDYRTRNWIMSNRFPLGSSKVSPCQFRSYGLHLCFLWDEVYFGWTLLASCWSAMLSDCKS